ncbi:MULTISPECIES: TRAFAC clade GTPase domain-containing protein [unclassified Pseudofrankia]|uniref:TRAFAC clade GTPase domain-containing protein n=1 Tax=unclassified Pseudofrankia TaxID=2994372 RepID=UPI0008DACDF9|nr:MULTISPECIES: hypothetical protein [unclassified Pseudofrankia]MDT3443538.1 hypothetical protein [Pseudofrankia sp. BMG5.37]OHV42737.1 hypothetical protein BCD48_30325 [Pseudofrankia sp. BMG5.36]
MTTPFTRNDATVVLCPTCLHEFDWNADPTLYERTKGRQFIPIFQLDGEPERVLRDRQLGAWKKCAAPLRESENPHFLPARYGQYGRPLVVAFVGGSNAGKSHLLAAMVREIERGALDAIGARADALDHEEHDNYVATFVDPLFRYNRAIESTTPERNAPAEFLDGFVVTHGSVTRPVVFFDVSGEVLASGRDLGNQFLLAIDAMIVVADWDRTRVGREDIHAAVSWTLRRLQNQDGRRHDLPVAIAINKCDEVRFEDPVMRWLRRPQLAAFRQARNPDRQLLWQESRDAYAYLFQRDMGKWLEPYSVFRQVTMHFVSATGSQGVGAEDQFGTPYVRFVNGVRPKRVLDPLVSVLAMSGLFGPAGLQVGVWPEPPRTAQGGDL